MAVFFCMTTEDKKRANKRYRQHADPFKQMNDKEIYRTFRFEKEQIMVITELIHDEIVHVPYRHGCPSPTEQVWI